MTAVITEDDVTVKDMFLQAELERSSYDPSIAVMYCQYILDGKTLTKAAEAVVVSLGAEDGEVYDVDHADPEIRAEEQARLAKDGHNQYRTFCRWRVKVDRFDQMVRKAIQERAYAQLEEIIDIANDATDDVCMGAAGPMVNGKAIRRAELMINTRKFVMSKVLPQVFGDKTQMELTGKDGKDLIPTTFNIGLVPAGTFMQAPLAVGDDAPEASEGSEEGQ